MVLDSRLSSPKITQASDIKTSSGFGLQSKVTILAVLTSAIPIVAISIAAYFGASGIIREKAGEDQKNQAIEISDKLNRFMFERYGDIQVVAKLPIFRNPKIRDVVSNEGRNKVLDDYTETYKVYNSIAVYDLSGNLVANGGQDKTLTNISKRDYFQAVLKTGKPFVSQPQVSQVTGKLNVFFGAPIIDDATGKVIYIARSRMTVDNLDAVIKNFGGAQSSYRIFDKAGKVFLATETALVGKNENFKEIAEKADKSSFISRNLGGNIEEIVGISKTENFQDLPNLNWEIAFLTETSFAFKAERQLLAIFAIGSIFAVLIVGSIAAFIANRNTRRLLTATDMMTELGSGNLEKRLEVEGQDEISQLGENVNLMADRLLQSRQLQQSQTRRSQIMSQIAQSRDYLELDVPVSSLLAEIRQELQCDRVVVYRFLPTSRGEIQGLIVAEAVLPQHKSAKEAGLSDPCIPTELLEQYKKGRVVATTDVYNANFAPAHLELMYKLKIKSNLVVPILRAGELDGLLIAHVCEQQREWSTSEIKLLQQKADEMGIVLGGLATLEQQIIIAGQERQRSEKLQSSLISLLGDVENATTGDLTVRAQITADDIGIVADFFNSIIESLRDVVIQVKFSANRVGRSVGDNDVAIRQLAEDAISQATQISETLLSIEEMTTSIQLVAKTAGKAADASQVAANKAEAGGLAIANTVASILSLRETVAETAKKVKRLGESSQQISKVVSLIDQIALKTNMLAVNASIEAARAGEEGKGFAIVAEEVGALAAQSAAATKEIERIVESIQQETGEVVEAMEASTAQVVEGTKQVEEAKQSLGQILDSSRQVNELFQSISIATTEQVNTSEVVKKSISEVAAISNRSSSTSKEVSQALQETVEITKQLQESVDAFKVN